jgi:hypothetical protein
MYALRRGMGTFGHIGVSPDDSADSGSDQADATLLEAPPALTSEELGTSYAQLPSALEPSAALPTAPAAAASPQASVAQPSPKYLTYGPTMAQLLAGKTPLSAAPTAGSALSLKNQGLVYLGIGIGILLAIKMVER